MKIPPPHMLFMEWQYVSLDYNIGVLQVQRLLVLSGPDLQPSIILIQYNRLTASNHHHSASEAHGKGKNN